MGEEKITITILYNNTSSISNLQPDWGFAAWIENDDKIVLFDTGAKGSVLLSNMKKLGLNPELVDIVIVSHDHWDHTGGLNDFLSVHPNVTVYLLASFSQAIKKMVTESGASLVEVTGFQKVCEGIFTTGEMGIDTPEQSLVITTEGSTVLLTGCAHPGIVEITTQAKELFDVPVDGILGGFHLLQLNRVEIKKVIEELKILGVQYVGPSHCTGEQAICAFREAWGQCFIESGCGLVIELPFSDAK